jgi:hypothetical protein
LRPTYKELDRIPMPEDVSELGVRKGDEGIIENLDLRNDQVIARVRIPRSTGQAKGYVALKVLPEQQVLSSTAGA